MKIKPNEVKILGLLKHLDKRLAYCKYISLKIKSPYNYTLQTLHQMAEKGWVSRTHNQNLNRTFYTLKAKAPVG